MYKMIKNWEKFTVLFILIYFLWKDSLNSDGTILVV
jgi:hypothetical protein